MSQASTGVPDALRPVVGADAVRIKAATDFSRPLENRAWVKAAEGHVYVCGTELRAGEGVLLQGERLLAAYADVDSVLLILELERTSAT